MWFWDMTMHPGMKQGTDRLERRSADLPTGSAVPAFTNRLEGDVGLSSAINSISVVCSIGLMVLLQIIML